MPASSSGRMVNVNNLLTKRRRNVNAAGASSSAWQPLKAPEGGSQPPQEKRVATSSKGSVRICGQGATPQPKHTRSESSEVRHGKGKPICPHLLTIDPSKDLWRNPDLCIEVSRHSVREVDLTYLQPQSADDLLDSAFVDLARLPAVLHSLAARARRYEEVRSKNEELELRCRDLTQENSQLKLDRDSTRRRLEEELNGVRQELNAEIGSGRRYLETLGGQRYLKSYVDDAISQFKKSAEFDEAVEDASVSVFDDCLVYCRERLVNSGRFPGEKFEFLDPDWVEMVDAVPGGDTEAARASQGTSLLPTSDYGDEALIDLGGEDAT